MSRPTTQEMFTEIEKQLIDRMASESEVTSEKMLSMIKNNKELNEFYKTTRTAAFKALSELFKTL